MSHLLAIETTGHYLGFALYKSDGSAFRRIDTYYSEHAHKQSETFFPVLEKLLKKNRVKREDFKTIVVDIGPGSFTGVRIGVAAARGFGQALGSSVIGISSLEAMAHRAFEKNRKISRVLSVLQALPGEVYAAVYSHQNGRMKEIAAPRWMSEKELPGLQKKMGASGTQTSEAPHPESLAALAIRKLSGKQKRARFDYNKVEPLYLQPSWAERKKRS